uniref:Formin-like protein n=1 Tax=Cajanus cajan TaxID=3821 RepID=A0A151SFA8_CAJCA|nr:Formin-like protein 5 [Cajanus cajan]
MGVHKHMVNTKISFGVLLVLLLVAAVSSIEKRETEDDFVSELLDPASELLDEHTAKVLWKYCGEGLFHLTKDFEDHLCLSHELSGLSNKISSEIRLLAGEDIQKFINAYCPQFKENFLYCLRKNNLPLPVSGKEDDFKIWHVSYMGPLFSRSIPRPLQPSFPPSSFFPKLTPPSSTSDISAPPLSDVSNQEDGHSNKKKVVLAVVITALVTFIAAALLFLCCSRYRKTGHVRLNDDRPLLSLSMSDYSVGPSSYSFGNSIKGEKPGFQSSSNSLVDNKKYSVQESQSIGALNAAIGLPFELKPPPGRVGTIPSGMPPLKPPPGRLSPLPPEPPSFRPTASTRPGPPPPPPPAPASTRPGPPPPPPPAPASTRPGPPPPPPPAPASTRPAGEADAPKAKLKPFFWDKVQANPDQSMVWNQIKSGSFQFNEEMIETLFGYNAVDKNNGQRQKESSSQDPSPQFIQVIDKKKAQNLLILLRALNMTREEVCDALYEGHELPSEFLQTLLKMAPTSDEELKLRLFSGDLSQLGPADQFLKAMVDIPFAFKRMEALLFMGTFKEELATTMESFAILEVACKELRSSRLFLKLLEAVLKTGNRMNDGTFRGGAQAFKLDTLLKLSDVKGTDGKTTLLHFVVLEIIRSEGAKAVRKAKSDDLHDSTQETEDRFHEIGLQVVSRLSSELENVKKAAVIDADSLTGTTAKLGHGLVKIRDLVNKTMKNDEGIRLFVVVRDFLVMVDKVCKEVRDTQKKAAKTQKQETPRGASSSETRPPPDFRQRLFPAIAERRIGDLSSDDESP